MPSIEITGKSLKDATQSAADELGVPAEKLTVTVLEESKGLFGKAQVRIRAEVAETAPEPAPAPEAEAEPAKPAKPKPRSRAKKVAAPEPEPEPEPVKVEAVDENEAGDEEAAPEGAPVEATEEDAEQFVVMLRALLKSANLDVKVTCSHVNGRYVNLEIDGRDVAFLVGKHGEVLNNLQYLINIIAGRKFSKGVRATLDGDNYRNQREQYLKKLATKIAEQVRMRGEEAVLDALPAFERRIVHKALDGMDGVTTYSEGEEPNRRVVIAPAE